MIYGSSIQFLRQETFKSGDIKINQSNQSVLMVFTEDAVGKQRETSRRDGHELVGKLKFITNFGWFLPHQVTFANRRAATNFSGF